MRSKAQILKTASTLKTFSTKIKSAQEGQILTPEAVQDIAMEIAEVAEVATELATEIAENVPAEESSPLDEMRSRDESGPEQIEVAQDDDCPEKKKEHEAMDEDEDELTDKHKMAQQVANLKNELSQIKRAGMLEKLATKYASLFPRSMKEAKMNEILTSKQGMDIIQAKVQEASDIITNKTMVKVASMSDSIYNFDNSEDTEVSVSAKL